MRKLLVLICAATVVLAVAGCGSSAGPGGDEGTTTTAGLTSTTEGDGDVTPTDVTAEQYEAAFTKSMSSGSADDGQLVLPKAAAECMAPKFVDIVTVEVLNEAGITEDDAADPGFEPSDLGLDATQGAAIVAAYGECDFDIYAELARSLGAGLDADVQQCIVKNLDHGLADTMLGKTFSVGENNTELQALLTDLRKHCDLPAN